MATLRNLLAKAKQLFVQNGEQKMLNLLTKTKPWMVASLLVATSAFGQNNNNSCNPPCPPPKPACPPAPCCKPCPPPREPLACPTIPAYNAPARFETRCPWDVWIDASFIYWQPFQDNMEPAAVLADPVGALGAMISANPVADGVKGRIINLNTKFKPGFKVGAGMNFDQDSWDGGVEYTRFHSTHTSAGSSGAYIPMLLSPTSSVVFIDAADPLSYVGSYSENWRLNMDLIDVDMGRSYYVGTFLTFRPSVGARGGWINQTLNVSYDSFLIAQVLSGTLGTATASATVAQKTKSWFVGPRFGINTNWMLGGWGCNSQCYEGFRILGNAYADLVFTRFQTRATNAVSTAGVATAGSVWAQQKINTVRTHLDFELGIGWGSYFDNNNWHFDLSATYGFQVFFDQNMFRNGPMALNSITYMPMGNLYIQGLTVTARLDF